MKHLAIMCIGSIVSLVFVCSSYSEIDRETIVGVWLFDEGNGQTAQELTGKSDDGTLMKGPKWVTGEFDKAIEFDGQDDYVEIGLPDVFEDIPNNDFTIAFWINVHDISGSGTVWTRILEARHDNSNYVQFDIQINDGELGVNVMDAGVEKTFMVNSPISANTWYHVTGTWNAAQDSVGLYLDGVLQTTAGVVPASPGTEQILNVGRRSDGSGDTHFDGVIDEFAIFNIALTEEDINILMEEGLKMIAPVESTEKLSLTWGRIKSSN